MGEDFLLQMMFVSGKERNRHQQEARAYFITCHMGLRKVAEWENFLHFPVLE